MKFTPIFRGVNLNRVYCQPDPALHPTIAVVQQLLLQAHAGGGGGGGGGEGGGIGDKPGRESNIFLYVDLHGHVSKPGVFMYGNHSASVDECVEALLLPTLMSLNSPHLHLPACRLDHQGLGLEGTAREFLYRATSLPRCYTMECSYSLGGTKNCISATEDNQASPFPGGLSEAVKYSPEVYIKCGRHLAISALDLAGENPMSRLGTSVHGNLQGVQSWLKKQLAPPPAPPAALRPLTSSDRGACLVLCKEDMFSHIGMSSISEFLDIGQNSNLNFGFFDSKGVQAGLLSSGPLPPHLSHILPPGECTAAVLAVDHELAGVLSLVTRAVMMLQGRLRMKQTKRLLLEVSKKNALFLQKTLLKIGLTDSSSKNIFLTS